jgi:uncharacterized protein YndB with AHSA1/START domain
MSTATMPAARGRVTVAVPPERAFEAFTAEIGRWWKLDSPFWNDKERRLGIRFEPEVGGRFIEVYDEDGEGFEIGRVTAWEPGRRLAYTWRQADWPEDAVTDVEVTFEPVAEGTLVSVVHSGFERLPEATEVARNYGLGLDLLLGWYSEAAAA